MTRSLLLQGTAPDGEEVQAPAAATRHGGPARQRIRARKTKRIRAWSYGLLLLALVLIISIAALLLSWSVNASSKLPKSQEPDWLHSARAAPLRLFATATPLPTPTPTLTPGQIAAQFVPQLQTALETSNWQRALEIVEITRNIDPSGEEVAKWAFTTYMQYGQVLVQTGQVAEAEEPFDQAVKLAPDDPEARLWQQTTLIYLGGLEALGAADWDAAIEAFSQAYRQMPDYGDLFDRVVESYRRQGEAALAVEDWTLAIKALVKAHNRVPDDAQVIDLLSAAYRGYGQDAIAEERWATAIQTLTQAHGRLPKDREVVSLLSLAYRGQAQAALAQEDWDAAVETLVQAQDALPNDQEVTGLLSTAYRQRGIAYQEKVDLKKAKADLNAALALRPDDAKAKAHLDQVLYILSKRIIVDISQQRLYAYQGDKLVYKWPVSTGLRGRDTATGSFQILDKIRMAYSRVWRLKMPYWMGVYYVQGIENGFHALPIRPDGSVMWGGLLGQRASYGCIILSNQAAKTLYQWADIGTPVRIRP